MTAAAKLITFNIAKPSKARRNSRFTTKRRGVESENQLQRAVADLIAYTLHPLARMWHVPNGGKRSKITAANLKRDGVQRGVPDWCGVTPYGRAAFLELKKPGATLSPEQEQFRDDVQRTGAHWACVDNIDDAARFLSAWSIIRISYPVAKADLGVSGHDRQKGDAAVVAKLKNRLVM